ncbi:TPA: hypothetical protein ACH3X1_001667 [Trebouxia sp. C0004]
MSENKRQVQDSCHNFYDCAGHHNLANTILYSLQSRANAAVSGRGTLSQVAKVLLTTSHVAHYLQKEHLTNIVSAYQAYQFSMDHLAVLPSPPTLLSNQEVDHFQVAVSKVVIPRDRQSCSGADDVYQ